VSFNLDSEVLAQIGMAIVLGGVLGLERERHGRAAGLRTMILVCLGSTMIMVVSERIPAAFHGPGAEAIVRVDPGRIAAGIVTGVGFLGAGVILKLGDVIRGVTTSASIWFVAALGIVIGRGDYGLAVFATGAAVTVLWLFQFPERLLENQIYRTITLTVDSDRGSGLLEEARRALEQEGMRLMDLKASVHDTTATLKLHVRTTQQLQAHRVVARIGALEGVRGADWE
jgi:putative Mg2+ transporter-C (MgtC) family protein